MNQAPRRCVLVAGVGAIGGIFAARMAARADVSGRDTNAAHAQAIGLPCEAIGDPMDAVWSKFVFNCVMNPVGALVGGSNAARCEVAAVRDLIDEMAGWIVRRADELGIPVPACRTVARLVKGLEYAAPERVQATGDRP